MKIDPSTSTLTCLFQNSRNITTKMCSVQYSQCDQELVLMSDGNSTSDRVILQFQVSDCYSYMVRASDGTNTVLFKGRVDPGKQIISQVFCVFQWSIHFHRRKQFNYYS